MQIIELLKKAKELYLKEKGKTGMCWCIKVIANEGKKEHSEGHAPYNVIVAQIPEFNPDFLGGDFLGGNYHELTTKPKEINVGLCFWWNVNCTDVRIAAFDKLIGIYENIDREFIW